MSDDECHVVVSVDTARSITARARRRAGNVLLTVLDRVQEAAQRGVDYCDLFPDEMDAGIGERLREMGFTVMQIVGGADAAMRRKHRIPCAWARWGEP